MKKALIHDWYYVNGGAEKVIKSFNSIWDDFDHYALVDFLNNNDRETILNGKKVTTSFIQKLPTARKSHQNFLQLFPYAIEQFNLTGYDLVLSSSASVSKGVLTNQNQLHICYCHSPIRYAWDLYYQYIEESGLNKGIKGLYAKYVLHKIRNWDLLNTNRVDYFIANSMFVAGRIKKTYGREAKVIYPPVDTNFFTLNEKKEDYYFTASRMVSYKKVDLIVKAFNNMPEKRLVIAGDGPEFKKIKKIAKNNIKLLGFISNSQLKEHLQRTKAFIYAAEEDFGIVPVEAQACGTPVIAYAKGGLKETIVNNITGIHFYEQSESAIKRAVHVFSKQEFVPVKIREHALKFGIDRFEKEIETFIKEKYLEFKSRDCS